MWPYSNVHCTDVAVLAAFSVIIKEQQCTCCILLYFMIDEPSNELPCLRIFIDPVCYCLSFRSTIHGRRQISQHNGAMKTIYRYGLSTTPLGCTNLNCTFFLS